MTLRQKPETPLGERIWLAFCDCFGHLYDETGRHVTVHAAELAVEICANVETPERGEVREQLDDSLRRSSDLLIRLGRLVEFAREVAALRRDEAVVDMARDLVAELELDADILDREGYPGLAALQNRMAVLEAENAKLRGEST